MDCAFVSLGAVSDEEAPSATIEAPAAGTAAWVYAVVIICTLVVALAAGAAIHHVLRMRKRKLNNLHESEVRSFVDRIACEH